MGTVLLHQKVVDARQHNKKPEDSWEKPPLSLEKVGFFSHLSPGSRLHEQIKA